MSDESEYEYSDDDAGDGSGSEQEENETEIEIENAYYEADDCKNSNPTKAAELFEKVVTLEESTSSEIKWRFKALEHLVVVHFTLKNDETMIKYHKALLEYISKSSVTRNECTSAINNILETISNGQASGADTQSKIYQITLDTLKMSVNNERLWFNTYVRFGKACLSSGDFQQLHQVVKELHRSCQLPDGSDDPTKGTHLLEVYALEIQYCTQMNDRARLKTIYPKTLNLNAAVADPRIMGVIREEGGKMYMRERKWNQAYEEFYESFRGYQEAGNPRAKDALKYVVLANMLALSDINPFAAREAKVFQEEKEVAAMQKLRTAYEANDLVQFERILSNTANQIVNDPFIMLYVKPLRRRMREQVLINLLLPYQRITLKYLATELKLDMQEVEQLLVDMIIDKRILGKIDQINGFVTLDEKESASLTKTKNYDALDQWTKALSSLSTNLTSRINY